MTDWAPNKPLQTLLGKYAIVAANHIEVVAQAWIVKLQGIELDNGNPIDDKDVFKTTMYDTFERIAVT